MLARNAALSRAAASAFTQAFGASVSWRAFSKLELTVDWTRIADISVLGEQVGYLPDAPAAPVYFQDIGGRGEYDTLSLGVRRRF